MLGIKGRIVLLFGVLTFLVPFLFNLVYVFTGFHVPTPYMGDLNGILRIDSLIIYLFTGVLGGVLLSIAIVDDFNGGSDFFSILVGVVIGGLLFPIENITRLSALWVWLNMVYALAGAFIALTLFWKNGGD